jgi:hypothetical protein
LSDPPHFWFAFIPFGRFIIFKSAFPHTIFIFCHSRNMADCARDYGSLHRCHRFHPNSIEQFPLRKSSGLIGWCSMHSSRMGQHQQNGQIEVRMTSKVGVILPSTSVHDQTFLP